MSQHSWSNPSPFWKRIAAAVVVFAFAVLFSWTNASNFDHTEYKMLLELGAVLIGREMLDKWIDKG